MISEKVLPQGLKNDKPKHVYFPHSLKTVPDTNIKIKRTKKSLDSDKKLIKETKILLKDLRRYMENQELNNYIKSVINSVFISKNKSQN